MIGEDSIQEIVQKNPNVMEQREPEIMVETLSSKNMELKIFFWIKDFNQAVITSAEVKAEIFQYFEKKGLTVSVKKWKRVTTSCIY